MWPARNARPDSLSAVIHSWYRFTAKNRRYRRLVPMSLIRNLAMKFINITYTFGGLNVNKLRRQMMKRLSKLYESENKWCTLSKYSSKKYRSLRDAIGKAKAWQGDGIVILNSNTRRYRRAILCAWRMRRIRRRQLTYQREAISLEEIWSNTRSTE